MIQFSGRIGKEPELNYFPDGTPVLNMSVSLYTGKDQNGNYKPSVWVSVAAAGALAETWENVLHKGSVITVLGFPKTPRFYVDSQTGERRSAGLEVNAKEIIDHDIWRPDATNPGKPNVQY